MSSYLAFLMALVLDTFIPDGFFTRFRLWADRFNQELEINLAALGAPRYAHLQWYIPLLIWLFGVYFLYKLLWLISPAFAGLLSLFILLYGLRFRHFSAVFTNVQLFLNQGDFFRARELLLLWMKEYSGVDYLIHRPSELVYHAIYHGTERALRQYFSLLFWFLLIPGPMGLVIYLMVRWSVVREREAGQTQPFAVGIPTMQQAWQSNALKAALSPRFVLFALEWLPARLLALTVGLVSQLDDAVLAWRSAMNLSYFSNRAPLTAVFFTAVGLAGRALYDPHSKIELTTELENPLLSKDTQVHALQQFRQVVFKCALVWLWVAFVFAVLGWLPG